MSFRDQTYTNKELLILYEDDDLATKEFVQQISDSKIRTVQVATSPKLTLGMLRNVSVQECNGEYFCQWDDDDWSHINRIEFQMDIIQRCKMPACIMMYWLIFDMTENQAYVSCRRPWEGSLLCEKPLIAGELQYEDSAKGEDTLVIEKLISRNLVFPVVMPKLYTYVYHGENTSGYEHWAKIFDVSQRLSDQSSRIIRNILENKYSGKKASRLLDKI